MALNSTFLFLKRFASGSDYGNVSMKDYEMLHQLYGFFPGQELQPGSGLDHWRDGPDRPGCCNEAQGDSVKMVM